MSIIMIMNCHDAHLSDSRNGQIDHRQINFIWELTVGGLADPPEAACKLAWDMLLAFFQTHIG